VEYATQKFIRQFLTGIHGCSAQSKAIENLWLRTSKLRNQISTIDLIH
jgi:hypothetical protein